VFGVEGHDFPIGHREKGWDVVIVDLKRFMQDITLGLAFIYVPCINDHISFAVDVAVVDSFMYTFIHDRLPVD